MLGQNHVRQGTNYKGASSYPKVSICMPVYNGEPQIRRALDSLVAQTFTDFELVISDNASTDGTSATCSQYMDRDKRIRYLRHHTNRGPVANFQFLLDHSCGEYFFYAAHDDYWCEDFVGSAVKALDANPRAALACGRIEYVDRNDQTFLIDQPPYLLTGDSAHRIRKYITTDYTDCMIYAVFRRQSMKGFRFATNNVAPEKQFIMHALIRGNLADAPGMCLRYHCGFKSSDEIRALHGFRSSLIPWMRCLLQSTSLIFGSFPLSVGLPLSALFVLYRFPVVSRLFRHGIVQTPGRRVLKEPVVKKSD